MERKRETAYPALTRFFQAYLTERNVEKALTFVTEDVYSIGTGENEVAVGRGNFERLIRSEISALPGSIRYRIEDYMEMNTEGSVWKCLCRVVTEMDYAEGGHVFYRTRFSGEFVERKDRLCISAMHMSEASRWQAPEEFFPLRYVSEHAKKLNEAAQKELLDILCDMMPGGIIGGYMEDEFPLYVVNDTMLQMMGYTYEEFVRDTGGKVINSIYEADRDIVTKIVFERMSKGKQYAVEYRVKKKDGTLLWVHDVGRKIIAEDGRAAIVSALVDISDSRKLRDHLIAEAEKDFLTGVLNRKGGETLISRNIRKGEPYMFFMIDLDNFKKVNDFYGHNEGDKMLCFLGELLRKSFRQSDFAMRLGGDEFAVFAQPCHSISVLREKAEKLIRDYVEEAEQRCPQAKTSVSIGGIFGKKERDFADLYKMADEVMYEIKRSGKGRCEIREAD